MTTSVPDVKEACFRHRPPEVLHVHGPCQAFPPQNGVRIDFVRDAPVREDIREVQLPAIIEDAADLCEDEVLPRAKVDDAVRYDHVYRAVLDTGGPQVFNVSLPELDVGRGVSEPLGLTLDVRLRHFQLLVGHVDADHMAVRSYKLRSYESVPSSSASEIEDGHAFKERR